MFAGNKQTIILLWVSLYIGDHNQVHLFVVVKNCHSDADLKESKEAVSALIFRQRLHEITGSVLQ